MVEIAIEDGRLSLHVQGLDRLWAFKSRLDVPLQDVVGARLDPTIAHGWWKGFRLPGTHLPGVIAAGTFYHDGKKVFWDVHDPDKTIVIDLRHESYDQLIVEVLDPISAVAMITDAIEALAREEKAP